MKKELNVITLSVLSIVFLLMIGYALADLPIQGNHDGTWGTHLNDWLEIGHNLTSGAADNFTDASIVAADIGFRNITAALIGTGAVNSTHIADRSIIAILLGTGVINATHIGDRNITAANMGVDSVNSTHLVDGNVNTAELANGLIVNASQVRVGNASMVAAPNITGIFVNTSNINLLAVPGGECVIVPINMSGIPPGAPCFASVPTSELVPAITGANFTYFGVDSILDNGRIRVCNALNVSFNPPSINYSAMCLAAIY